ncbi:MAG TPA: response regulator transcription factor [Actinomycetota bacterium]
MRGDARSLLRQGEAALASGDWQRAREVFDAALADRDTPEARDGLGRALWWLRDVDGAIEHRERAHAAFRKDGDGPRAARIAMWLAIEYAEAIGNDPISRGWFARAEGLLKDAPPGPEHGWLALTRTRLRLDPTAGGEDAASALETARRFQDPELEASALALAGLVAVERGDLDAGLNALDEAMVLATGTEVADQEVFGDICCLATRAAEDAGDVGRLMKWNEVVMTFMERSGHAPLLEFCGTCCAEVLAAGGNLGEAEGWLVRTLAELEDTGHRARCVHPAAKLAELRLLQGRVEEAERLLAGYEDRPDGLRAAAAVHLAQGETAVAAALLHRRLNQVGDALLAVPLLALLADVQLAQGELHEAGGTAERLEAMAVRTGQPRVTATAALAAGRVAAAAGDRAAEARLEEAIATFVRLEMPIEAAKARIALARAVRENEPELARREAQLALEASDAAGATRLADEAAALLRELGGRARTGPKGLGLLSKRELEVLALLGEGLSNAEIAARLYISTKTAGNHVSSVLSKLNVRSRQEAAAYAVRYSGAAEAVPAESGLE